MGYGSQEEAARVFAEERKKHQRGTRSNKTGLNGVHAVTNGNKGGYYATISFLGKAIYLGTYDLKEDAAVAFNNAASKRKTYLSSSAHNNNNNNSISKKGKTASQPAKLMAEYIGDVAQSSNTHIGPLPKPRNTRKTKAMSLAKQNQHHTNKAAAAAAAAARRIPNRIAKSTQTLGSPSVTQLVTITTRGPIPTTSVKQLG